MRKAEEMAKSDPWKPDHVGIPVNFYKVRTSHDFNSLTMEGQGGYFVILMKMWPDRFEAHAAYPEEVSCYVEGSSPVDMIVNLVDLVCEDRPDDLTKDYIEDAITDMLANNIMRIEDNFVVLMLRDIIY